MIGKFMLSFLLFILVSSCKDSAGKKSSSKSDNTATETKKDNTTKKDESSSSGKGSATKWNANESTAQIKFSVKGLFGTVHGSLSGLKSTILFDEKDLSASSIHASVDPKTISTGSKMRNRDLQKEKYFNSDNFSALSFQSDNIQKSGTGYKAVGKLTIKGVAKNMEMPFQFVSKGNGGVFKSHFTIERKDYGVGGSGGSIGNTVTVDLEVPVNKS